MGVADRGQTGVPESPACRALNGHVMLPQNAVVITRERFEGSNRHFNALIRRM